MHAVRYRYVNSRITDTLARVHSPALRHLGATRATTTSNGWRIAGDLHGNPRKINEPSSDVGAALTQTLRTQYET